MFKQRIKKLEEKLKVGRKSIKIWHVKFGQEEEQISEIKAGKVEHPDGGYYSEKDINYFLDFDLFFSRGQEE